jgi:phytoene synthase
MNPDVSFALGSAPATLRPALAALWALDEAFGKVLATGREPMVSRIRLAWWREALERLDREPPPKEPVLQGVASQLIPAGLSGAELAGMEEGGSPSWAMSRSSPDALDLYAARRGGLFFACAARLLGGSTDGVEAAGEAWALTDLARPQHRASRRGSRLLPRRGSAALPRRWSRALRPLGMLSVLADRDRSPRINELEPPGAPPRVARMLRHRLTGW